jgi:hypothetical protein
MRSNGQPYWKSFILLVGIAQRSRKTGQGSKISLSLSTRSSSTMTFIFLLVSEI